MHIMSIAVVHCRWPFCRGRAHTAMFVANFQSALKPIYSSLFYMLKSSKFLW